MRRLGRFLLALTLAFAALELAIRYVVDPDLDRALRLAAESRWVSHPFQPYAGRRGGEFDVALDEPPHPGHIRHNSYGFRAHPFPAAKQPEDFFVLCFGDSATYGFTDSNADTWPERLERLLAARYPERHVQVFNLGVEMATTAISVVNFALIGVHLEPDLVITYQGYDDLTAIGDANFRFDHAHFYRDLGWERVFRKLAWVLPRWSLESRAIAYFAGASNEIVDWNDLAHVVRLPRVDDPDRFRGISTTLDNLAEIHALALGAGAPSLHATLHFGDPRAEELRFNGELRTLFEANRWPYIDPERWAADDIHPACDARGHFTASGNQHLAQDFFDLIVDRGLVERQPRLAESLPLPFNLDLAHAER